MVISRNILNTDPIKGKILEECFQLMRETGAIPEAEPLGRKYGVEGLSDWTLRKWRKATWRKVYDKVEDTLDAMLVEMHATASDQIEVLLQLLRAEPNNSKHRNDLLKYLEYLTKLHGLNAPDKHMVTMSKPPVFEMNDIPSPDDLNESGEH